MKDYFFSEIIAHCEKMKASKIPCSLCMQKNKELYDICSNEFDSMPAVWHIMYGDLENRDIIGLPYKQEREFANGDIAYEVFYRGKDGKICSHLFQPESYADEFMKKLKVIKEVGKNE